jgi:pimeloyl-ACP methyl ester carboxylesterase
MAGAAGAACARFRKQQSEGLLTGQARRLLQQPSDQLDTYLPGLRKKVLLPGVGHAAAEESADQVNELLLEFLTT